MPSPRHDALTNLIRDRPGFAAEILTDLLGVDLPDRSAIRLGDTELSDRTSKDLKPDAVVLTGPRQAPTHAIVVEIQQQTSERKRRQLARYAAAVWLSFDCEVTVLVVCPTKKAAAFYAEPVRTTLADYTLRPHVLDPDHIPVITDPYQVADNPSMGTLSVTTHGQDPAVLQAFLTGIPKDEHGPDYYDYACSIAAPPIRQALEARMADYTTWPSDAPLARHFHGRGKAEGRVEGKAEGEAKMILMVLDARGIPVTPETRDRIANCGDVELLELWGRRAATAETIDDLFR
ncbi:hypothetical protein [Spirillospora sp. NPDC047279]|uniref:hypothetical protein n=1 Tax=Spirillospora sp. NPDC047279 TaxID=3155478 RepID=UPI0033C23A20